MLYHVPEPIADGHLLIRLMRASYNCGAPKHRSKLALSPSVVSPGELDFAFLICIYSIQLSEERLRSCDGAEEHTAQYCCSRQIGKIRSTETGRSCAGKAPASSTSVPDIH
jgi:hypothetical protein